MGVQVIHTGGPTPPPANPGNQPAVPTPGPGAKRLWARVRPYAAIAWIAAVSAVLACGVTAWLLGPGQKPAPSDGVTFGRNFRGKLDEPLAKGFDAYADAVAPGKVPDADKALKKAYHDASEAEFERRVGEAILAITPDGSNPTDPETIERLRTFHRDFARGLRGAK